MANCNPAAKCVKPTPHNFRNNGMTKKQTPQTRPNAAPAVAAAAAV